MLLPYAQYKFNFIRLKPLDGAYKLADKPDVKWFTWKSWFNEKFQQDFNKSIEDNSGFRNLFIRINNQLDYSFFRLTGTHKAIIGISDCLYEEGYILDYTGSNFVGKDSINRELIRAKWLQDYLKKEKNIDLIFVFEPGKASFFPEYIPERYHPQQKTISNYLYYSRQCKTIGINYLDLNAWFIAMKDTSTFPLFPKYGVHWSTYAMYLATDTLIKFIEKTSNIDLANISFNKINVCKDLKDVDFDIELTLNLLFPLPHETMAYPEINIQSSSKKSRPNVLTIADSYYWSIYNSKIPQQIFNNHQFWYYNTTIYPDIYGDNAKFVDHSKDKENIEKQDILLVMITEMNLNKAFFGFVDRIYSIYKKEEVENILKKRE